MKIRQRMAVFQLMIWCICFIPGISFGEVANDIRVALTSGAIDLQLRLGYEYSRRDDVTSTANGLNLRTRLGYRTKDYLDANVYVQFHNLTNLIEDFRFNPQGTLGGDPSHDVIADPDGSRVHQAYFEFKGLPDTQLRLGRQEIILDDARLIGNVNWRQNGQTFDALSLRNESIPGLTLHGSVIDQVNTILLTDLQLDHLILLNAKLKFLEDHYLVAFGYLLDTEAEVPTARDSATYGLRLDGTCADWLRYDFSYSRQDDYESGENHEGDMWKAFVGVRADWIQFGVGYNRISGQDGAGRPFDTLFSTAHKYNGWADQFLDTNTGTLWGGLEDIYFETVADVMGTRLIIRYHLFDTTERANAINLHDQEYGHEFDVDIQRDLAKNLSGQLGFAYYKQTDNNNGLNPTTDEDLIWARVKYQF